MNRTSIATLTLRIAALYLWMQATLSCTTVFFILAVGREQPKLGVGAGVFGGVVADVIVGAVLWIASRRWADRMLAVEGVAPIRTQEIGTLAFRLVGIWLLVSTVRDAGEFLTIPPSEPGWVFAARVSTPIVKLGLGLTLLFGGATISRRCFPDDENPRVTPSALQPIGFSILGLVVLSSALPVLVSSLVSRAWYEEDGATVSSGGSSTARIVAAIVRVAIGLWLFLGFGALGRFWRWIQTAGLDRQSVSRT